MHEAILKAALSLAAAYGADAGPVQDKAPLQRLGPSRPAIERTMGVIKPPVCIDLGMLKHIPEFSSAMPNGAFDPSAIEKWKSEIAQCARDGALRARISMWPPQ